MSGKLGCILYASWLAFGLVQLVAISEGLQYWFRWLPDFLSLVGAVFLCNVPVVGWLLTYQGAVYMWHWHWYWALALAAPQIVLLALLGPLALIAAAIERRRG